MFVVALPPTNDSQPASSQNQSQSTQSKSTPTERKKRCGCCARARVPPTKYKPYSYATRRHKSALANGGRNAGKQTYMCVVVEWPNGAVTEYCLLLLTLRLLLMLLLLLLLRRCCCCFFACCVTFETSESCRCCCNFHAHASKRASHLQTGKSPPLEASRSRPP